MSGEASGDGDCLSVSHAEFVAELLREQQWKLDYFAFWTAHFVESRSRRDRGFAAKIQCDWNGLLDNYERCMEAVDACVSKLRTLPRDLSTHYKRVFQNLVDDVRESMGTATGAFNRMRAYFDNFLIDTAHLTEKLSKREERNEVAFGKEEKLQKDSIPREYIRPSVPVSTTLERRHITERHRTRRSDPDYTFSNQKTLALPAYDRKKTATMLRETDMFRYRLQRLEQIRIGTRPQTTTSPYPNL